MGILTLIWAKLWKLACAIGAILLSIGGIWLYGREAGKKSMQSKVDNANASVAAATINTQALESRHETDVEVQRLPDAPAQAVEAAAAGAAAGKLRDDGWLRD